MYQDTFAPCTYLNPLSLNGWCFYVKLNMNVVIYVILVNEHSDVCSTCIRCIIVTSLTIYVHLRNPLIYMSFILVM